jgi:hypothetical protein
VSFYTGTQCELLYAMPASGSAVTAAAATILSGTSAANPPFGLPATQNTAAIAVTLAATGAWTTVISQSNVAFEFEVLVTCTAPGKAGTNGSYNCIGHLLVGQANNAATPTLQTVGAQWATPVMMGAPQTAAAFDPTVTQYVEVSGQWSVTTGSPTQTLTNFYVFGLN